MIVIWTDVNDDKTINVNIDIPNINYFDWQRFTDCITDEDIIDIHYNNDGLYPVKVGDKNINELTDMSINKIKEHINSLKLSRQEETIADQIIKELNKRLQFLIDVGLEYLTLTRSAGTLSGGEAQRIRLATQIESALSGVLYILDEPLGGVDPATRDYILDTILTNFNEGASVIISTHLISDIERILDEVIFIDKGKINLQESADKLRQKEKDSKSRPDLFIHQPATGIQKDIGYSVGIVVPTKVL